MYKKTTGWIILPHICFVEYMCKWKLRNWGTLEFLKAKKFRCMWRSPFEPLFNFLNRERVYKDSIWSRCNQIPAKMNFAQPRHGWEWQARVQDRPRIKPLHYAITKLAGNSFSQTPARLTVGHLCLWLVLPWLALPVLPCCHRVKDSTQYITKKSRPSISQSCKGL